MSKKDDINEKYWKAKIENRLELEYKKYLEEKGKAASIEQANLFAIEKTRAGRENYLGYSEREIILLLAGELPFMYD